MRSWKKTTVAGVCAAYAAYCWAVMPPGPISAPDSAGYLASAPIHVLGYPLLLRIAGSRGTMIVQPLLFSAALAALGVETLALTSSVVVAILIVVAPMLVPGVTAFHFSVLTESPFMAGLIAFLACAVAFVRAPSARPLGWASAAAGATATIRRTGVVLVPVLVIMLLLERRRLTRPRAAIAATLVPVALLIGGERLAARLVHGDRLASEAGRHLYAKAALLDAPAPAERDADPTRAALQDHLGMLYAPVRELIRSAPPEVADVLSLSYEGCLQGPCVPELGLSATGSESVALQNDLTRVALARIARAPFGFLALTARDYRSLWTVFRLRQPGSAHEIARFMATHRPLPFETADPMALGPASWPELPPVGAARAVQWIVTAIGWMTGALAIAGLCAAAAGRVPPDDLSAACIAAVAAHAGLLFSALLAAGLSRFTLGMWPAVSTSMLLGLWWAARNFSTLRAFT